MIKQLRAAVACLLMVGLIGTSLGAVDDPVPDPSEPPVRLKKKAKPAPAAEQPAQPAPKKEPMPKELAPPAPSEEPKDDLERNLQDLEEKIREITNRVSRKMSSAEDRLHKKDPGQATQQTQREIVRDLDELIDQTLRQQQRQQQQQSSRSSSRQNQRDQQAKRNRSQQNEAAGKRPPSSQAGQAKTQSGNNPRGGKIGKEENSKIADLYKDIWGHLPESLRQEMDQYSREQFMAKYGDLLKQYYATIAEKGRRKGGP